MTRCRFHTMILDFGGLIYIRGLHTIIAEIICRNMVVTCMLTRYLESKEKLDMHQLKIPKLDIYYRDPHIIDSCEPHMSVS